VYDYHGDRPVEQFLEQRRQAFLQMVNKLAIDTAITNKLTEVDPIV
jgi:hypothetical protein